MTPCPIREAYRRSKRTDAVVQGGGPKQESLLAMILRAGGCRYTPPTAGPSNERPCQPLSVVILLIGFLAP